MESKMERLFVYGIFLDEDSRLAYGMRYPQYATVRGYATVEAIGSGYIVEAIKVSESFCLTGLLVYVPSSNLRMLDALEGAYDRERVQTTSGVDCWMYVAK